MGDLILISPSTARTFHQILFDVVMKYEFPQSIALLKLTGSKAPLSFFSSTESGTILNSFSQGKTLTERQLAIGVLITVSSMPSLLIYIHASEPSICSY